MINKIKIDPKLITKIELNFEGEAASIELTFKSGKRIFVYDSKVHEITSKVITELIKCQEALT